MKRTKFLVHDWLHHIEKNTLCQLSFCFLLKYDVYSFIALRFEPIDVRTLIYDLLLEIRYNMQILKKYELFEGYNRRPSL